MILFCYHLLVADIGLWGMHPRINPFCSNLGSAHDFIDKERIWELGELNNGGVTHWYRKSFLYMPLNPSRNCIILPTQHEQTHRHDLCAMLFPRTRFSYMASFSWTDMHRMLVNIAITILHYKATLVVLIDCILTEPVTLEITLANRCHIVEWLTYDIVPNFFIHWDYRPNLSYSVWSSPWTCHPISRHVEFPHSNTKWHPR